jgi:superfamily I DNA and/or RNA helicase
MHADIAAYPNQHFYGGQLEPALPHQFEPLSWPPSAHPLHPYFQQRVAYIRTQPDPRSKINDEEAELVVELIRYVHQLYGTRFDPATTVGVITPFRAQIANIRQKLPAEYQSVTIDTVERFQGAERDVIIVSFAIKSRLQLRAIQSINEAGVDRKLNVAMTRAKEHLIMMGVADLEFGIGDFGLRIGDFGLGIGAVEKPEIEVHLI